MQRSDRLYDLRWAAPLAAWLAGGQDTIRLWDANGQPRLTITDIPRHTPIYAVTPSPDGRWLYSMTAGGLGVWDASSGARHAFHPESLYWASHLCISPDGKHLAGICQVHAGELLCAINVDGTRAAYDELEWDTELEGIAFSPDSTRLRVIHVGAQGQLIVTERDPCTLKRLEESCLLGSDAGGMHAFLNDSEELLFYWRRNPPGTFDVFSLDGRTRLSQLTVPLLGTRDDVSLAASGRWLVLRTPEGEVERWDVLTAHRDGAWVLAEPRASGLAVSPDGTVAVGLENGTLALLR